MWLFLSNAALSVVADREDPSKLLVRSRLPADINTIFPKAKLFSTQVYDYKYRALIDREEVAQVVADQVRSINYDNFKDSVSAEEDERHDAYLDIWHVMQSLQE